uniref:Death domain containing 1 n=1 Tax=Serinus canaria TaxID=9135 RepID=A0A8C9MQE1_SERCA
DALTGSEEDILSGILKDISDRSIMNRFEQRKKEVVRDCLKGLESEDHKLTEKMEDSKIKKNNEIFRNYRSTFTSSSKGIACFIKPPATVLENLKCNILNDTSSLVVDDSEELVSNVISIECYEDEKLLFPINIAIPFSSCFRENYQEIMVKVTDTNFQSSYLTPISLQRYQGNHKESFAEVKIYHPCVFSVLSCLKKETFTVPKAGLLQKLNVDSRISFCYHPETFSSPAPMQLKIQPIEPSLVSALKARHMYHSVIPTSTLVHVQHPSSQPFNKLFLCYFFYNYLAFQGCEHFCEKKSWKQKEGWKLFDDVIIQNKKLLAVEKLFKIKLFNLIFFLFFFFSLSFFFFYLTTALGSFALHSFWKTGIFSSLLRLWKKFSVANVILYQKRENPYKIVVLLSASRELTNELQNLHEEGYFGPPESIQQFPLRQGEQIHLRFRENISASENGEDFRKVSRLIFHSQKQRLEIQIKVDEFGNHSSPHYKGTAVVYKITRETIPKKWEQRFQSKLQGHTLSNCSLVRLKCPDNLTHQIYELLCCWKKTSRKSADKQQLLSRYLQKSGRSDLSEELHFKWQNKVFT